ncbi:MAG: superoxide dismutase family protein [Chitinivibrionales bacterium]
MRLQWIMALAVTSMVAGDYNRVYAQQDSAVAAARLKDPQGNDVGEVLFFKGERGVVIRADIMGLAPGEHAFHIHEKAACEAPDFTSAGGHFNPGRTQHGFLNPKGPHAGDLPNITVTEDSSASMEVTTDLVTLDENKKHSLFRRGGTAIVIHQNPDDYITDPAGRGGDRIACGEIEKTQ